jgi:hypothetical protein
MIFRTDREDGHKSETGVEVTSLTHAHTCFPYIRYKQQGSAYRLETLKCCLQLFMNIHKHCAVTQTSKLLGFRNKSVLAGDLNAKHPVWNSQVSNSTGMKLLEVFVSQNCEISAPQCSRITLLMGKVIWTLWYIRTSYCQSSLSQKFWSQITCQSCLAF